MRVDLVAPRYHPVVGGIEDHVAALAQRWRQAGDESVVHTLDRDDRGGRLPPRETVDGVLVRRWPARRSLGYYTTRFDPELSGRFVHLHGYGLWTHDAIARRADPGVKVMTLHHGLHIPTSNPINSIYHWWHGRTAARRTLEAMQAVIAVSPIDVERLRANEFPEDRLHLIPNGVPASAFQPAVGHPPPPGCSGYFLFLGRLHVEKEPVEAIRALARLPRDVGLIVAGPDQGELARVRREIGRQDVEGRVLVKGRVGSEEKARLLKGARALVLPSRYEAQGRVILEAWAQKTPVIASKVGGVPYVVKDGADGLLHPWRDTAAMTGAMERLWFESSAAQKMGAAGFKKAEADYQEERLLDRTLALCRSLVERS